MLSKTKEELINIMKCYSQYIEECFNDLHDLGQTPVCIWEFIDNEYQEMLDAGYNDYSDFIWGKGV